MKFPSFPPRVPVLLSRFVGLLALGALPATATEIPRGSLTVDRTFVRSGDHASLSWQIRHPAKISDLVEIRDPYVVRPNRNLHMRVRLIGAWFMDAKSNNGHGNNIDGVDSSNPGQGSGGPNGAYDESQGYDDEKKLPKNAKLLPFELLWAKGTSSWTRLFYDTQDQIDPSANLLEIPVVASEHINFAARGYNEKWLPLHTTATAGQNVVMFKNGDLLSSATTALSNGAIENYLRPYLTPDGTTVKIGNRDLIVLFELDTSDTSSKDFNLQDLAILVSFDIP